MFMKIVTNPVQISKQRTISPAANNSHTASLVAPAPHDKKILYNFIIKALNTASIVLLDDANHIVEEPQFFRIRNPRSYKPHRFNVILEMICQHRRLNLKTQNLQYAFDLKRGFVEGRSGMGM
ncbi:hypothetical protein VNO78_11452 [Psophocarpus tetragonolobus]|uniref:Uncharacterized protein n=1 Tax=Psophocarpus tetragonolobus TaxID=3891 RepID=A0AAN9SLG5_PSOTE